MSDDATAGLRESPFFLTTRAALALSARCRKALRAQGIDDVNPAQLSVLAALDGTEAMTPTQLAAAVLLEKSTLTPLLERLEKAELLLRARDPKDKRVHRLYITRKGRKRRREVDAVIEAVTAEVMGSLPRKVLKHHVAFCQAVLDAHDHPRNGGSRDERE